MVRSILIQIHKIIFAQYFVLLNSVITITLVEITPEFAPAVCERRIMWLDDGGSFVSSSCFVTDVLLTEKIVQDTTWMRVSLIHL